jgi:hypothetical protein
LTVTHFSIINKDNKPEKIMRAIVLAEKPSVAKELARVLNCHKKDKGYFEGPQFIVTWALGHLVTLDEPAGYDPKYKEWRMQDLPMLPEKMKLKVIRETSHQFRTVTQLMKRGDIDEFIIATDAGREGELVARLPTSNPVKTMKTSSALLYAAPKPTGLSASTSPAPSPANSTSN